VTAVEGVQDIASVARSIDRDRGSRGGYRTASLLAGMVVALITAFCWMLTFATREIDDRIARPPGDVDPTTLAVEPFLGFNHWYIVFEVGAWASFLIVLTVLVVRSWEQRKPTIGLLFFFAGNSLAWLDPWGNWAPYATYDPRLLHWPETWAWASISPTVEPVFNFVGYFAFYIGPPALAILIQRRLLGPRVSPTSFVHRHPLITLTGLTIVVGFIIDACIEIFFVKTGLYGYSQVPKFGSINVGRVDQFPLILESGATTLPFIACSLLWWRNDTGLTGAERLANQWRFTRQRGLLGVFGIMFVLMSFGYMLYLAPFAIIRYFDLSSSPARPWRWCATQVYDPQGRFEEAGEQGPFFEGIWSGLPSGQSDGRQVDGPAGEPLPDACTP
jgi:hypothetical protein